MPKLTLADVANILGNPTSAANTLNNNSALIESALENTLSRNGLTPNQMLSDIDMNNNDILNVDNISANVIVLDGQVLYPTQVSSTDALLIQNSLSEIANNGTQEEARDNLGLGTASTADISDFATAAQGSLATTALQSDYENVVSVSDFGALPDCTDQGIGTDVTPAIVAAISYALSTYGDGCSVVLPAGRYRAATSAVIDLQSRHNIKLDFLGSITTDNAAMSWLTLRNAYDLSINLDLFEGGVFDGWAAPSTFAIDYNTVADVVALGGQEGIRLEGVLGCDLNLRAYGYAGRMLRTTKAQPGHPQTGGMRGSVTAIRNHTAGFSKARTFQSIYADYAGDVGVGYWGTLDRLTEDFSLYGPTWIGLNDIMISIMDCAYGINGPRFEGCVAVKGNIWYIGDIDTIGSGYHAIFRPIGGSGARCSNINVHHMAFLNKGNGALIDRVSQSSFSIEHIGASSAFNTVADVTNTSKSHIKVLGAGSGATLMAVQGAETDQLFLDVENTEVTLSNSFFIQSDVPSSSVIQVRSSIVGTPAGQSSVVIATDASVSMSSDFLSSGGGSCLTITAGANKVKWVNGTKRGASTLYGGATPSYVSPSTSSI